MKKRKNYGRKIKRSRINLYPKKKTKAQKTLGTILLVLVILGIVFLGYCLGKPLLEYMEKHFSGENTDAPVWTPPAESTSETSASLSEELPEEAAPDASETTAAAPLPEKSTSGYVTAAPSSALANSASLSAFAAKAASEGYTAVMVQLKDSGGNLRYLSELEGVEGTELITGSLSAEEIVTVLTEKGLEPVALISVLADNAGCTFNPDMSYKVTDEENVSWLDYTYETPIRWADPESAAAIEYNRAVYDELRTAGFGKIILADVIFPDFQDYDRRYIEEKYFRSDRYKLLAGVVPEGAAILVNAEDIIINQLTKTAEVLKNKTSVSENEIIVRISRSAFTSENGYPADAANLLEVVMVQAAAKTGLELTPMIEKTDFTPSEIEAMQKTAEKMGFEELYVR